jgi:uncharacterized protein RhaS with RHS repeats
LYQYRARYYDPSIGRFISEDPKGFGAGVNFYAYTSNNPINANDPSGMDVYIGAKPIDGFPNNNQSPHHTVTVLIPNTPSDFTDRTGWNNYGNNGIVSTLSGQPSAGTSWATFTGQSKLLYTPNWKADQVQNLSLQLVPTPDGMTDTQFISQLINSAASYKNNAQYNLTPAEQGGYNSNSFTSGLFNAVGVTPPAINYVAPGYSKPLPINTGPGATGSWDNGASGSWGGGASGSWDSSAAGGFLLYPNKPNTNQMQSVYSK